MYSVFFSYSHRDKTFVKRIVSDLKRFNVSVWFDEGEIKLGESLTQKIGRGLRWKEGKDKLIVIDFLFSEGILRKHSNARIKTYKKKGYKVNKIKDFREIKI